MNKAVRMWLIRASCETVEYDEDSVRKLWAHAIFPDDIERRC